jgi:predicted nucleic acid-binding protein
MKDLLLDTNTLNYILKRRQPVLDRLQEAREAGSRFLLAPIAHHELTRYLELKGSHGLMRLYRDLVEPWLRCDLVFDDWSSASRLWAEIHRSGRSISGFDLLLATLARKHRAVLVTSNMQHFKNLGLDLEDWAVSL